MATGYFRTKSRLATAMQQKYCDQGRSMALLTTTWPIRFAPQFLWLRREPDERIDLSPAQEPHRLV